MEDQPEIVLRDDKILEVGLKEDLYQINLKNTYIMMISKEKEYINVSLNGVQNFQFPLDYYEGLIVALKESKLFDGGHYKDYYTMVSDTDSPTTNEAKLRAKKKLDDIFVNIKSEKVLSCFTSEDIDKDLELFISIVDKGTIIFMKHPDMEIPSNYKEV